jgi:DNA polymerase III epsilon subunit-like protein
LLENTSPSGASILKDNMMRLNNSKDKKSLCNIVCDFLNDLEKSDLVVGHNINFDILMMIASAKRVMLDNNCDCSNLNNLIELLNREKLNKMCTMKDGTEICEIPRITKTGKTVKKMINVIDESGSSIKIEKIMFKGPKLIVLFDKLFNINIDTSKLHDSKYDVLITLLVYLKLKDPSFTLPNTSNILTTNTTMREYYNLLNNITMKTGGKRKYKKKSVKKIKRNKITKKKNMRKKKKTLRRKKYSKKNFLKNTKL